MLMGVRARLECGVPSPPEPEVVFSLRDTFWMYLGDAVPCSAESILPCCFKRDRDRDMVGMMTQFPPKMEGEWLRSGVLSAGGLRH
jgi:hypothetical protein